MDIVSWTAAAFVLALPSAYRLESSAMERIAMAGGLASAVQTSCVWRDSSGQSITLFWWRPYPPRPGGPLVAVREIEGVWAGKPATFIETSMFNGTASRVSVAYQDRPALGAKTRISATGLNLETLQELLRQSSARDVSPEESSDAKCERLG